MSAPQKSKVTWKDVPTRTITAGGVEFAYRELGTDNPGTPVVFLIHLAAVLDNWDPRVIDGFAAKHRVIKGSPPGPRCERRQRSHGPKQEHARSGAAPSEQRTHRLSRFRTRRGLPVPCRLRAQGPRVPFALVEVILFCEVLRSSGATRTIALGGEHRPREGQRGRPQASKKRGANALLGLSLRGDRNDLRQPAQSRGQPTGPVVDSPPYMQPETRRKPPDRPGPLSSQPMQGPERPPLCRLLRPSAPVLLKAESCQAGSERRVWSAGLGRPDATQQFHRAPAALAHG